MIELRCRVEQKGNVYSAARIRLGRRFSTILLFGAEFFLLGLTGLVFGLPVRSERLKNIYQSSRVAFTDEALLPDMNLLLKKWTTLSMSCNAPTASTIVEKSNPDSMSSLLCREERAPGALSSRITEFSVVPVSEIYRSTGHDVSSGWQLLPIVGLFLPHVPESFP